MSSNRAALLNAFAPSREIDDPRLFAGRRRQVSETVDALHVIGACPLIYGDRGLGKSSLAIQTQLIAMGSNELLREIGASNFAIPEESSFITFYLACSDEIKNTEDLIQALVNVASEFDLDASTRIDPPGRQLLDRQTRKKISFKVFEMESTNKYKGEVERVRYDDALKPSDKLWRTVRLLQKHFAQPILFIIDELDRVKDLSDFSSIIRNMTGEWLKFLLVGVAQHVADLNLDHPSIERVLVPVRVPRMDPGELADVVDRAISVLRDAGENYSVSDATRTKLVRISSGFPWFVHVIGQQALLFASDENSRVISYGHVTRATRELINNRFAQHFADMYRNVVRDSRHREIVLRVFASFPQAEAVTAEAYGVCKQLGVSNLTIYKSQLSSEDYGSILLPTAHQRRGLVRFQNEMFKQYVFLSQSINPHIDEIVESATANLGC